MVVHRWSGLVTMVFLAIAAITGCVLCFAKPLDEALNRDLFRAGTVRQATAAPPAVVSDFQRLRPELQVVSFPLHVAPGETIPVNVSAPPGMAPPEHDQLFLDPSTGKVVGARSTDPGWDRRHIVAGMAEFHYNLLAGDAGRWLMGCAALIWFLSNFIGFYLTLPQRKPLLGRWKRIWQFRFSSPFPRQMLDLHRASGLWLFIGIAALAFTSVCLNFYGEFYEPAVTRMAPLKYRLFDQPEPFPEGTRPKLEYVDAVRLAREQAASEGLAWRPATALYNAGYNIYGVTFTDDGTLNYRALGPIYLYFDAASGKFVHRVDPYVDSAGLVMIRILYPVHSGQVAGWPTVALVFLLGLATLIHAVTGFYIWWKKRKVRRPARNRIIRGAAAG
jgi:uncharacterized iron-regulated membrane protein